MGYPKLYNGNQEILRVYKGSDRIQRIYKGGSLVWDAYRLYIDKRTVGVTSVVVPFGRYRITVVGGGGGSSNGGNAGAGAYWKGIVDISSETIVSATVGAGGAGCEGYARNHDGYPGAQSSLSFDGFSVVCPGGEQSYQSRNLNRAGYTYAPVLTGTYTTEEASVKELGHNSSWYNGYGEGGLQVGQYDEGNAGRDGYVKFERLY